MLTDPNKLLGQGFKQVGKGKYVKIAVSAFGQQRCTVKHTIVLDRHGYAIQNILEKI